MASTSKKWFIGCGIGCGLIILISAGIGGGLYFAFKDVAGEAESIEESFEAMETAFGSPFDFTPQPDGSIAPERMDAFLAARAATAESRDKMESILLLLDDDEGSSGEKKKGNMLDKIKAGMKLIPATMTFIKERNEFLVEQGMGSGEYTYIYSMAYFNFLDKPLTDGPSFQMTGDDGDEGGASWRVNTDGGEDDTRQKREKEIRRHLHRMQMSFLDNQLDILSASSEGFEDLRAALEAEKESMESARRRLLWEENFPEAIRRSLEPYRVELDESYSPVLNVLEVGMVNGN